MSKEYVYCKLVGMTASFKVPAFIDGVQLTLPAPSYSSIQGLLSFAAGRTVMPGETSIGFKYEYHNSGLDLEKFHRFGRTKTGSYTYENTNIRRREFHHNVSLELILDNTDFYNYLDSPKRQLFFGRSQDLAIVDRVELIQGKSVDKGNLWGTLLPITLGNSLPGDGIFYNLPEYFDYTPGKVRKPMNFKTFLALNEYEQEIDFDNLIRIEVDGESSDFYLHPWQ